MSYDPSDESLPWLPVWGDFLWIIRTDPELDVEIRSGGIGTFIERCGGIDEMDEG